MHALRSGQAARRAVLLLGIPCLLGVTVNALRSRPLPWVANRPYEILTECPETLRTAEVISAEEALKKPGHLVFVDARPRAEFLQEHAEGALSIPYEPLLAPSDEDLQTIPSAKSTLDSRLWL